MRIQDHTWAGLAVAAATMATASAAVAPWLAAIGTGAIAWAAGTFRPAKAPPPLADDERRTLLQRLRRRDEQLAHTAHELRTPLTSVITALEMLREGYAETPAEQAEFLDQATVAARHLAFLVNDVLDEAAMAAGQLRVDCGTHSVRELLACAMQVMGPQARSRGIVLEVSAEAGDLLVRTDPRRFQQIVFNLVGNALKFTSPGDRVRLCVEERGAAVRFQVVDGGPGVPHELRDRLFSPFGRGDSAPGHAAASTGLGLHVCRLLVEQLGGRIAYEPGPERGSVFWFEQPLAAPAAAPADEAMIASAAGGAR